MTTLSTNLPGASAAPGPFGRLRGALGRALSRLMARRLAVITARRLGELDEHLLRDIGLDEDSIRRIARRPARLAGTQARLMSFL